MGIAHRHESSPSRTCDLADFHGCGGSPLPEAERADQAESLRVRELAAESPLMLHDRSPQVDGAEHRGIAGGPEQAGVLHRVQTARASRIGRLVRPAPWTPRSHGRARRPRPAIAADRGEERGSCPAVGADRPGAPGICGVRQVPRAVARHGVVLGLGPQDADDGFRYPSHPPSLTSGGCSVVRPSDP